MKTKTSKTFRDMPTEYAALCRVFLPRPIHDKIAHQNTTEIADLFAGFEERMTADQNDFFDLLCDLIEKWESESLRQPKARTLPLLKHLLAEHRLTGADLSRILGKSLSLGPMILRGERRITAAHAILLGKHFGTRPDLFLG